MRLALIGGGVLAGSLALWFARQNELLPDAVSEVIDNITPGGFVKVANMKNVSAGVLGNANIKAMLRVIRHGEGTDDAGGYNRLFGGGSFASFNDHPRVRVYEKRDEFIRNGKKDYTTAAGAYQMTETSWDETKKAMNLPDFSPRSQDLAAVGRIAARGALPDVLAGNFDAAIKKINREWASLPGSPYGQPTVSMDAARRVFLAAGGLDNAEVA